MVFKTCIVFEGRRSVDIIASPPMTKWVFAASNGIANASVSERSRVVARGCPVFRQDHTMVGQPQLTKLFHRPDPFRRVDTMSAVAKNDLSLSHG
jgi:hypothetical protein